MIPKFSPLWWRNMKNIITDEQRTALLTTLTDNSTRVGWDQRDIADILWDWEKDFNVTLEHETVDILLFTLRDNEELDTDRKEISDIVYAWEQGILSRFQAPPTYNSLLKERDYLLDLLKTYNIPSKMLN